MNKKLDWSWLGFLKIVPMGLAIASGGLTVARDGMFLSGNASPAPLDAYWAWLRICFVISAGIAWLQQHKRIKGLEQRLMPKMRIGNPERSVWPYERHNMTGAGYHFDIENLSESESLDNVRAQIVDIQPPPAYLPLPVPMKVKHDDYKTRHFSINPRSVRQIDLVTGPVDDPRCLQPLIIVHTVTEELTPAEHQDRQYRITVKVGASNATPAIAVFQVWIEQRELRCVAL